MKMDSLDRPYVLGPGWWAIMDAYLAEAREIDPKCELEEREKYGELRARIVSSKKDKKKELHQIERAMEEAAWGVCECCGASGTIVELRGWQYTLCARCAALDERGRREAEREVVERYNNQKGVNHDALLGIGHCSE